MTGVARDTSRDAMVQAAQRYQEALLTYINSGEADQGGEAYDVTRLQAALMAYAGSGDVTQLGEAYETARLALQAKVPLSDFSLFHFAVLRDCLGADGRAAESLDRVEDFFLQGMAVYDMALRGYVSSMSNLTKEIAERRRVEQELRDITFELARQRDELDQKVKKRTAEIRTRAEELEIKNRQLTQTNQEQSNFSYALSHDLKTPINTIHCFLEVLLEDHGTGLKPEARELIGDLIGTAGRMRQLVDDVLDYSKVVKHQFTPEPVDLDDMVRLILKDMGPLVTSSGARIVVGPMPVIRGSPFQMRVLLTNLLSNALKYIPGGKAAQVRVACGPAAQPGKVRISVTDNGLGIPDAMQSRVFDLFKRLHRHDEFPGSGIGLALCKRVAENHGASISLTSEPGKGTAFSVDLELQET